MITKQNLLSLIEAMRIEVNKFDEIPVDPIPVDPIPDVGQDDIDINSITILEPCTTSDIKNWPIRSLVTRAYQDGTRVGVEHTMSGLWPLANVFGEPPTIEGNICIVICINGIWYGAGFDWLGKGRTEKNIYPEEFGRDQIRISPLDESWPGPQHGDRIGLFVTTPSSLRIGARTVNERSNIKLITWN
jgi:hypothetical protein